jgi:hypothetical protein
MKCHDLLQNTIFSNMQIFQRNGGKRSDDALNFFFAAAICSELLYRYSGIRTKKRAADKMFSASIRYTLTENSV